MKKKNKTRRYYEYGNEIMEWIRCMRSVLVVQCFRTLNEKPMAFGIVIIPIDSDTDSVRKSKFVSFFFRFPFDFMIT